jgi:hypothetical protein
LFLGDDLNAREDDHEERTTKMNPIPAGSAPIRFQGRGIQCTKGSQRFSAHITAAASSMKIGGGMLRKVLIAASFGFLMNAYDTGPATSTARIDKEKQQPK